MTPDLATIQAATPRCPHVKERLYHENRSIPVVCDQPMRSGVNDLDGEHWRCPHGHVVTWAELAAWQRGYELEEAA